MMSTELDQRLATCAEGDLACRILAGVRKAQATVATPH
jgi:hypothetical protein